MAADTDPLVVKYNVDLKLVLGSGADGGVVRGVDRLTNVWHAMKYMSRDAYSPKSEMDILSKLKHPNIVPVLGVYAPHISRRHWVMVMPEADFNLNDYMARSQRPAASQGRLQESVARDFVDQLLSGATYLHARRVMHRDIKPTNVLLFFDSPVASRKVSDFRLWLADFSRARLLPALARISKKRPRPAGDWPLTQNISTPAYCAPEALFAGSEDHHITTYGLAVDTWSFGAVLF